MLGEEARMHKASRDKPQPALRGWPVRCLHIATFVYPPDPLGKFDRWREEVSDRVNVTLISGAKEPLSVWCASQTDVYVRKDDNVSLDLRAIHKNDAILD